MEKVLNPVSSQDRIAHLDLLANGEKVLTAQKNKYLPMVIACVGLLAIAGIIIYYETRLNEAVKKD